MWNRTVLQYVWKRKFSTENSIPSLGLFKRIADPSRQNKLAIISEAPKINNKYTYNDLLQDSGFVAKKLLETTKTPKDLKEARVGLLCNNSYDYVRSQWGIWRAGGIFVPLCISHPPVEIEYVLKDSEATVVICDKAHETTLKPIAEKLNIECITLNEAISNKEIKNKEYKIEEMDGNRGAMIVYTSGTTGRPKGVVTTHNNIESQIKTMITSWEWSNKDHILHVLPLHHVHGIVNVLLCPLYIGATCEIFPKFDSKLVWDRIIHGNDVTLFMAVPTIYSRLMQEYKTFNEQEKIKATEACKKLRLMVSGSAPLPESVMKEFHKITGHWLLERYGMTEIGMALSNPYKGERRPGFVGKPLPTVEACIVDETNDKVVTKEGESGELRIKGPSVFKEYWNKKEATQGTFDKEGWFKTGDIATVIDGYYKILGRASVDIIKSAGYKISALDIERDLLEHPSIQECAVVGVEDIDMGQLITALIVLKPNEEMMTLEKLRTWGKEHMASYKVPRRVMIVESIPKNAMGKVNKKELIKLIVNKQIVSLNKH